ncbi:MAG TPA: hypothetical protein VGR91_20010 [Stellaceae bacterium]|nr:hypothetical protein [Stellaceae bacterium]
MIALSKGCNSIKSFRWIDGLGRAGLGAALCLALLLLPQRQAAAQNPLPGSIHGNVAVIFAPVGTLAGVVHPGRTGIGAGSTIYVSDIQVTARNVKTRATSAPVLTNAEGFFRTPDLAPGQYEVCVGAPGFTASCLDQVVEVFRPVVTLGKVVPIRPAGNAIVGTATLADHQTPCFFFRPSFSAAALTAKASLLGADGKPVAGPVNGNISGQYVLPVPPNAKPATLRVTCDASVTDAPVTVSAPFTVQNATIAANVPRILAFDFSKAGVGVRRADPGDTVGVSVLADDPDGNPLHYSWADASGRALGLPDAATVSWPLLNANALNTLIVYVSNGKGGIATYSRPIQAGPNENFFSGHVFNRQTGQGVTGAAVTINGAAVAADADGNFRLAVPDAAKFVLNVTRPGFALASLVLANRAVGIRIPLDPVQIATVSGAGGGTISVGPGSGCCRCGGGGRAGDERFHLLIEIPESRIDIRHGGDKGGGGQCPAAGGNLSVDFPPGSFVTAAGAAYTGSVSVEAFQYDLSQPNPIPGDLGAVFGGKPVRLGSFGAFHLLPRDASGQPLAMAPGMHANVSLPIQPSQLAAAPATIPLFHYDETTGQWIEDGKLTRAGNSYVGAVTHFSVFNADTVFPGGACVKVLLSGFTMPVTLDAVYYDPSLGTFHHNGFTTSDTTVGVERMTPNQSFTLDITDSGTPTPTQLKVPLFSGPGLDPATFPSGYDSDTVNFSHCNGPVQIANNVLPPTPPTFLGPVFGGSFTDNSANYQAATDANPGGSRDTLNHWKTANGFHTDGTPAAGEATGIYFNNGDLKFGRDMHCRVTSGAGATACYVSNFGVVGTDDAAAALTQAENYEASGQTAPQPAATVAMEYDPANPANAVQFWAYKSDGSYLAHPTLDSQGPKPMPDMCLACHQGTYSGTPGSKVNGASFLAFDMDSFLDDTATPFPTSAEVTPAVQTQFHLMNNMVAGTSPPPGITELINLWYTSATPTVPFTFNQSAAQLPGQPFLVQPGNQHHEPLYDSVVKLVCRTCHVALPGREWETFSQMSGEAGFIQSLACAPTVTMPHAEVPWRRFWQQSLSSTLSSELLFPAPGCPPS